MVKDADPREDSAMRKIKTAYEARAGVMKALGHAWRSFIVEALAEG